MNRLLQAVLIIAIAFMLWVFVNKKAVVNVDNDCTSFTQQDIVEVVAGHNEGAVGVVLRVSHGDVGCLYHVRGQRGVEMPFSEWYQGWELASAPME